MTVITSLANSSNPRQTHYDVLQVSHTATMDEIKAAYRSLIIGCHPDKLTSVHSKDILRNHDDNEAILSATLSVIDIDDDDDDKRDTGRNHSSKLPMQHVAKIQMNSADDKLVEHNATMFHELQAAYHCLHDPENRRQYDETISRTGERVEWKWKGASAVKLSDMECDWCCVVDEGNRDTDDDTTLQKIFFHPCRCGDTFQVFPEEIMESVDDAKYFPDISFTNRVWQCESCSLTIRIEIDIEIDE